MPTIAQELIDKGKVEGINIGKKEGKMEVAVVLLKKGVPIETIIEATNLSRKEIENLRPTVH